GRGATGAARGRLAGERAVRVDRDAGAVAPAGRAVGRHVQVAVGVPHEVVGVADTGGEDLQRRVLVERVVGATLRGLDVDRAGAVDRRGDLRVVLVPHEGRSGEEGLPALAPRAVEVTGRLVGALEDGETPARAVGAGGRQV